MGWHRLLGLSLAATWGCAASSSPPAQSAPVAGSAPAASMAPAVESPAASLALTAAEGDYGVLADSALVDDFEVPAAKDGQPVAHPLDGWSDAQIEEALLNDPESLGSISLGKPNGGALFNGVQMPEGDAWQLSDPGNAWGTQETIDNLLRVIAKVHQEFPNDTPRLYVGHISARSGGHLRPHVSHQAGRDVDLGYYYDSESKWFTRATTQNLDRPRSWALVRALITETDVELILIDYSLQSVLKEHALSRGEDPDWVASVFKGVPGELPPLIRHAPGHATHMHVRFYNPVSRETARRVAPQMLANKLIKPPTYTIAHRVRKGETLGKLAKQYNTTVKAIQRANGLRSTVIIAKKTYRIPTTGGIAVSSEPIVVPPRRLPPGVR